MPALEPILQRVERPRPESLVWPPLIIGHRGAAGDAPENTLAAFELALRQGASGIEFDVRLSADGVPVVIHDARLDRTTSGSGRVGAHSLKSLRRLDAGAWFNQRFPSHARARYRGLRIPVLAEVMAWVRKRGCLAFLEIKRSPATDQQIEARVLEGIHSAGVAAQTTVISFDFATLRRLRELDSRIALGIDFTRPVLAVRRAGTLRASVLLPHWAFASQRFIRRAHRAGMRVLVWDVDELERMSRKILDGVDGIITRFPARLAAIVSEAKQRRR